jgi:phage head maturation protease
VPVNLFHDARSYVGRVAQFFPDRSEGLVTELRIYPGAEGDRTLEVADDDGYSASIGFGVRGSDQQLDQKAKTRVIKRAFIDHVALVPSPAYVGAGVLSVRGADESPDTQLPRLVTPSLDEFVTDPVFQWAAERSRAQTS